MPHEAAQYLADWQRRIGKADAACAAWCELSVSAFRRQRAGKVKPDRMRQTVKLAKLHAAVDTKPWLDAALAAAEVAKSLTRRP